MCFNHEQSQSCAYIVLGACIFLAVCILIVFATRKARGQNLQDHGEGCQCPVCAKSALASDV